MFDLHCHVLPGLDDGAGTPEEALKMLEKSAACGVRGVAATPHSQKGLSRSRILSSLQELRAAARQRKLPIRIYAGQELLLNEEGLGILFAGEALPINGSRYLLAEFEFEEEWEFAKNALVQVRRMGLIPIVAHPERYAFFCENVSLAGEIHALGGLLQVNRGSIMGRHGEEARAVARHLLRTRQADLAASDGHSPYLRTPELRDVHERISLDFSYSYAERLLNGNPQKVLKNETISR